MADQNLYAALKHMVRQDGDYATSQNGVGFNKLDTQFGHSLAGSLDKHGALTPKQAKACSMMLRRYARTQLSGYDLSYKNLPTREPKAKAPKARHENQKLRKGEALISRENGRMVLKFGYDKHTIARVKEIKGRRWDAERKVWTVPFSAETKHQVEQIFDAPDFDDEIVAEVNANDEELAEAIKTITPLLSDDAKQVVLHMLARHGYEVAHNAALAWKGN